MRTPWKPFFSLLLFAALLSACLFKPSGAEASPPVLLFSDIDSGPKTGNSDAAGGLSAAQHGAIVTVWGCNLGSTQGTSKVYVGGVEAAHVYYWKDADGQLPGGPSDLKTFHRMQEIAFSIPAGAPDGATTIKVISGFTESTTLPFTVRAGRIFFVRPGGSDSGTGSWNNPWATLGNVFAGGNGKLVAGDTVYSAGVGSSTGLNVGIGAAIKGTAASPVSLIAYPNTSVQLSGKGYTGYVIFNYNNQTASLASEYLNLSKLSILAAGDGSDSSAGMRAFKGNRIVGIEITGPTVYGGYSGAIGGNMDAAGGGKYLGVYIHNYGTDNGVSYAGHTGTDPSVCAYTNPACKSSWDVFQHLYYLSNRQLPTIPAYEIGWNHLSNNPIYQGIHIYDQGTVGGWSGTFKIHDNVVRNQRGNAINIDLQTPMTVKPSMEIYNNLIISDQSDTYNFRALNAVAPGVAIKWYNNTVYGYNNQNRLSAVDDYRNNIMVDTKGVGFHYYAPVSQGYNLFHSPKGTAIPTWATPATGNISGDPGFFDALNLDFRLKPTSPARLKGGDAVLGTAPASFLGKPRKSKAVSIGAIDFDAPPEGLQGQKK